MNQSLVIEVDDTKVYLPFQGLPEKELPEGYKVIGYEELPSNLGITPESKTVRCDDTGLTIWQKLATPYSYYVSPYDEECYTLWFMTEERADDYEGNSDTIFCETCCRVIDENDGYKHNFVFLPEKNWVICLKCLQEIILEEGQNEAYRNWKSGNLIPLAHIEGGDYEKEEETFFVNNHTKFSQQVLVDHCNKLDQEGYLFYVAPDYMSIVGDEGWVRVYKKPKPSKQE